MEGPTTTSRIELPVKTAPALAALGLLASAAFAVGLPSSAATTPATSSAGQAAVGWIVVLEPGTPAARHARAAGVQADAVYRRALQGYAATLTPAEAGRLADQPGVAYVQRDALVHATAQTLPTGVNRANADASSAQAGNGSGSVDVDVAILDTGIDLDHPDLNVHTAGAKNCSSGRSADDGNGHGTHVAGTVGAKDDANGVVGMAPGARLWPVRVLNNKGSGTISAIVCGIDYVAAHADQIEVANMSLGGTGSDDGNCGRSNGDAMHQAVCGAVSAGVTFVVAAGNEADDAARHVPASYDEVITVSALADFNGLPGGGAAATCRSDVDDTFASFSNYGSDVDLIAPGVCIRSTWRGGGYSTISGTSMAAPHVAGGAALYLAGHPTATPAAVRSALQAAGTTDWNNADDKDAVQEKLLDVDAF